MKGTLFTELKTLPVMRKGGSIVLNGSIASATGQPAFNLYSASKAAIRSFARCWTIELRDRGIRVNVISPGSTETPLMMQAARTEEEKTKFETDGQHLYLSGVSPIHVKSRALYCFSPLMIPASWLGLRCL